MFVAGMLLGMFVAGPVSVLAFSAVAISGQADERTETELARTHDDSVEPPADDPLLAWDDPRLAF